MEGKSLVRDSLIVGIPSFIFLLLIGAVLALIQSSSPVPFLLELVTDPFWLFVVAITLFSVVGSYRQAK